VQLGESEEGDRPIVGTSGLTVRVTEIYCGVFVAPAALIVIVLLYVPAERPDVV